MKIRVVSLLLACVLLLGLCGTALADEFNATLLTSMDISGAEYYSSSTTRAVFALLLMLDYYSDTGSRGGDSITDDYDFTTVYLQKWNDQSLYLYIMPTSGGGFYEFNYYHSSGSKYYSVTSEFKSGWTKSSLINTLDYQNKPYVYITLSELGDAANQLSEILN